MIECREHGDMCAYTGSEPGKCSTCHCDWAVLNDGRGFHSCELTKAKYDRKRSR